MICYVNRSQKFVFCLLFITNILAILILGGLIAFLTLKLVQREGDLQSTRLIWDHTEIKFTQLGEYNPQDPTNFLLQGEIINHYRFLNQTLSIEGQSRIFNHTIQSQESINQFLVNQTNLAKTQNLTIYFDQQDPQNYSLNKIFILQNDWIPKVIIGGVMEFLSCSFLVILLIGVRQINIDKRREFLSKIEKSLQFKRLLEDDSLSNF